MRNGIDASQQGSEFNGLGKQEKAERLLALLLQGGGEIKIEKGKLLVRPPGLAQKLANQIRELKPEILIALWRCPVCLAELEMEALPSGNIIWCKCGKYEHWRALRWKTVGDLRRESKRRNIGKE